LTGSIPSTITALTFALLTLQTAFKMHQLIVQPYDWGNWQIKQTPNFKPDPKPFHGRIPKLLSSVFPVDVF